MLNDIRVHIHQDEQLQEAIEQRSAVHISKQFVENRNIFARKIPNLAQELDTIDNQNISIFCNKNEEYNLVDFGLGRTFYGENPSLEIEQQLALKAQQSVIIDYSNKQSGSVKANDATAEDTLVILGLGLGGHIKSLVQNTSAKHVIIYEPESQFFKCASMVLDWKAIIDLAEQMGITLYFQLHKDARDIITDLDELKQHFSVNKVLIFQHYFHPMFDCLMHKLRNQEWSQTYETCRPFQLESAYKEFCPAWLETISHDSVTAVCKQNEKFIKNLSAFEKYYPNIFTEFKDYTPQLWQPMVNDKGEVNLLNSINGGSWHGNFPEQDGQSNFENFAKHPNRDGLILGYNGEKLKHYLHYRLVKKTERLLEAAEDEIGILPDTIKSLILFGLGSGYQLQALFEERQVEKLFICEPNRDFFYASLYAIDWHQILTTIDKTDGRLYINIGDDGTHLFRDLLGQFYNIGPYVLSQTYFYQGYYNAPLNAAIGQLREQLQIVISMGEYFDHACYGIAHTKEMLRRGVPYMRKSSEHKLSLLEKELPIVFIGNGPSLDYSLQSIKEIRDQAILVSCGTSLQVLHRNGIVPDFHAEIEQNRATHDWAVRVDDADYLKKITLISCNGIHPDTCELYKDVKIAFKEGESSTVSMLNIIGEANAEALAFAFPTVTNFALNFFLKLGFNQMYLMGVDLGFVDATQHHSTQSGYYDSEGKELYNYAQENNTGLLIPGNFRSLVNTKHEFKIAKMIMEQSLAEHPVDCYNTSDGARIDGTHSLNIDDILLVSSAQQKQACIASLEESFEQVSTEHFVKQYEEKYSKTELLSELTQLHTLLNEPLTSKESIYALVEAQKQFLFASYNQGKTLFFYYLYGSMNYINAVLSKAAMHQNDAVALDIAEQALRLWSDTLADIHSLIENEVDLYDCSASFVTKREKLVASKHRQPKIFVNAQDATLQRTALEFLTANAAHAPEMNGLEVNELEVNELEMERLAEGSVFDSSNIAACLAPQEPTLILLFINKTADWEKVSQQISEIDAVIATRLSAEVSPAAASAFSTTQQTMCYKACHIMLCITCEFSQYQFEKIQASTDLTLSSMLLPCISQTASAAQFERGEVPYGPIHFHLECALRHFWDMPKYQIFIEKQYFSLSGSKNASTAWLRAKSTAEQPVTEAFETLDVTDTKAAEFIQSMVVDNVAVDAFVDFKTYLGLPRNQHFTSQKQQKNSSTANEQRIFDSTTVLDQIGSRGLVVKRQFEASEVFRTWAKMPLVHKCISDYMKADKHV